MLQFHRINVVSDLIILKACSHFPGFAIWLKWLAQFCTWRDADAHFDVLLTLVELRVWSIDFDVKSGLGLLSKEDR